MACIVCRSAWLPREVLLGNGIALYILPFACLSPLLPLSLHCKWLFLSCSRRCRGGRVRCCCGNSAAPPPLPVAGSRTQRTNWSALCTGTRVRERQGGQGRRALWTCVRFRCQVWRGLWSARHARAEARAEAHAEGVVLRAGEAANCPLRQ